MVAELTLRGRMYLPGIPYRLFYRALQAPVIEGSADKAGFRIQIM